MNGLANPITLHVMTMVMIFMTFTSCESISLIDDPRASHLIDVPIASPVEWSKMRAGLVEDFEGIMPVLYRSLGTRVTLDYFINRGYWYAATVSIIGEDTGAYMAVVGWFRGSEFSYRYSQKNFHLNHETLANYQRLKATDSLWQLIDDSKFWSDTLTIERVYWESGYSKNPLWGVRMITVGELEEDFAQGIGIPRSHSGWMAYMAAISSHVFDSNVIKPSPGRVPNNSFDFVVHQEKWFFEFLSVNYDSKFAWSSIVGQHLGDSIIYRFVGEPLHHLEPDKVADYKSAAKMGNILTLTGQSLESDKVESYQQLWHDAAATSVTRVWRIGQGNL